jgi:hypothetical protein
MKYTLVFGLLLSSTAFSGELKYANYLRVQEALASDDFKTGLSEHKKLCDSDLKKVSGYKDCGKDFKNIDELRESFKKVSEIYIKQGDKKDMKGLILASCPMASAQWIQKEGGIKNPYYGKSMLLCGEKIKN